MKAASSPLFLVALITGCTPPDLPDAVEAGGYQDWFTPTWETCGQPDEWRPMEPMPPWDGSGSPIELLVSEACTEQLWADMKLDLPQDPEDFDYYYYANLRVALFSYVLLASPLGSIDDFLARAEAGEDYLGLPVAQEIATVGDWAGETEVRPVLYNMIMSGVLETVRVDDLEDGLDGLADGATRTIYLPSQIVPYDEGWYYYRAGTLVHEGMHQWLVQGHVLCPEGALDEGEELCDEDWHGAHGFTISTATLLMDTLDWEDQPDLAELQQADLEKKQHMLGYIISECCAE